MAEDADGEGEAVDVFGCFEVSRSWRGLEAGCGVVLGAVGAGRESGERCFECVVDEDRPEGEGLPEGDETLVG